MMEKFELNILGCGAAVPAVRHFTTSQALACGGSIYMIDCGEGAQRQFRAMRLNLNRLDHIFLSHLHGDHCLGLIPLVFTMELSNRTTDLHIHAHSDAQSVFEPLLNYFCPKLPFRVRFNAFNPDLRTLIFEDENVKVHTIPLRHAVPAAGFLFEQQHTTPAVPSKKYAYCSDTAYAESIVPVIEGVDLLYHEATFVQADLANAEKTLHTTAAQAAQTAKAANVNRLIIGHFSARYNDENVLLQEAAKIFPNTVLADEKMTITI